VQPHNGLDVVFGAREDEVEFMPDIGDRIAFDFDGKPVQGGGFLQSYSPTTGTGRGHFADGRLAIVENSFGAGKTLLVGTHPGISYFKQSGANNLRYFAEVFAWTGKTQQVRISNPALQARLHEGPAGKVLWVLNSTRETQHATLSLDTGPASFGSTYWAGSGALCSGDSLTVPPRDVMVVRMV
jgi:beta-galactosidase